jgi:anti-sigma28 factor (negative regulator of flagellin synthesis)
MKIQNINNNNHISFKNSPNVNKKEEVNKANKYDVIEFKVNNEKGDENISLHSIKRKLVSQINEESNGDKINRIKESINNKTYSIDVEEIVNRLLK